MFYWKLKLLYKFISLDCAINFRDKRRAINVDDFTIENLENCEKWKLPGSINGQQLVIQNCRNCIIYLLDHINTITIDDCVGCKFILGPVKGR